MLGVAVSDGEDCLWITSDDADLYGCVRKSGAGEMLARYAVLFGGGCWF